MSAYFCVSTDRSTTAKCVVSENATYLSTILTISSQQLFLQISLFMCCCNIIYFLSSAVSGLVSPAASFPQTLSAFSGSHRCLINHSVWDCESAYRTRVITAILSPRSRSPEAACHSIPLPRRASV